MREVLQLFKLLTAKTGQLAALSSERESLKVELSKLPEAPGVADSLRGALRPTSVTSACSLARRAKRDWHESMSLFEDLSFMGIHEGR